MNSPPEIASPGSTLLFELLRDADSAATAELLSDDESALPCSVSQAGPRSLSVLLPQDLQPGLYKLLILNSGLSMCFPLVVLPDAARARAERFLVAEGLWQEAETFAQQHRLAEASSKYVDSGHHFLQIGNENLAASAWGRAIEMRLRELGQVVTQIRTAPPGYSPLAYVIGSAFAANLSNEGNQLLSIAYQILPTPAAAQLTLDVFGLQQDSYSPLTIPVDAADLLQREAALPDSHTEWIAHVDSILEEEYA